VRHDCKYAPGSPEWHARLAEIQAEESKQPFGWFYLSFADVQPIGWLGAVIVQARGILEATDIASAFGINPGGEVKATRLQDNPTLPPGTTMEDVTYKLLTMADMEKYLGGGTKW
jgi:hypothetical protein